MEVEETVEAAAAESYGIKRKPDKQHFDLERMVDDLKSREERTERVESRLKDLSIVSILGDDNAFLLEDRRSGLSGRPTHWSLTQLCSMLLIPPAYIRRIPSWLAMKNLEQSLRQERDRDLSLTARDGEIVGIVEAEGRKPWFTDLEIAEAAQRAADTGPWLCGGEGDLFTSDRDLGIFLSADDEAAITVGNEAVYRGLHIANSEVGGTSFSMSPYFYVDSCEGRLLWADRLARKAEIFRKEEPKNRLASDGPQILKRLISLDSGIAKKILSSAMAIELPSHDRDAILLLKSHKLNATEAEETLSQMGMLELPRTLWGAICGALNWAHEIEFSDARIAFEARVGRIMRSCEEGR